MDKAERIKKHQWDYLLRYLREKKISYDKYLLSDHWKDVKARFYKSKLNHHCCYACLRSFVPLQLHHKTYRRIGNERLNDLVLLCPDCHKATHEIEKSRPAGILYGAAKRLKKNLRALASA